MKRKYAALGCALLLCMSLLAGCGGKQEQPVPTPEDTAVPTTPDTIVDVPNPETTPEEETFDVTVDGSAQAVRMTQVQGAFPEGPKFSLFVDLNLYTVNDVDGYCYVTPVDDEDAYGEIGFHPGAAAASLSGTILREYGSMQSTENLGEMNLGENKVTHVSGETMTNCFDVYLLDTDGGCVSLVICTTPENEAAQSARLLASLETLKLS